MAIEVSGTTAHVTRQELWNSMLVVVNDRAITFTSLVNVGSLKLKGAKVGIYFIL